MLKGTVENPQFQNFEFKHNKFKNQSRLCWLMESFHFHHQIKIFCFDPVQIQRESKTRW
jgi:hypothetical protein